MNSPRTTIALVNAARYDPPMRRVVVCEDCGWELRLAKGYSLPLQLVIEAIAFDAPPHRFLVIRCPCGAELGVWADRDGVPVSTPEPTCGK